MNTLTNVFKQVYIREDAVYAPFERNSVSHHTPPADRPEPPAKANGSSVVEDAKAEAYKMIAAAREEATNLLTAAEQQAEAKLMEAQQEGYEKGLAMGRQQALEQAEDLLEEIQQLLRDIQKHREQLLKENNEVIKTLVLETAKKVIMTELDKNNHVFTNLIMHAVQESTRKDWVKVYVSDAEYELVMSRSEWLQSRIKGASFVEIIPVPDAPKGTCMVETPSGIVDASVDVQLNNISQAFAQAEQSA